MEQFDVWKEDILRSVQSVHGLTFIDKEQWATVNRLITMCLHQETHQIVANVILKNYKDLGNMDPMELFQHIKERLEAMQPEIRDQAQKKTQQIPELWQQLAPSTDRETRGPGPDDRSHVSHLARRPDNSPFIDPKMHNYGKAEHTMESTSASETEKEDHT